MPTKTVSDKSITALLGVISDFLLSANMETSSDDLITTWRYLACARRNGKISSDDIGNWALFMLASLEKSPRSISLITLQKSLQRLVPHQTTSFAISREFSRSLLPLPVTPPLAPVVPSTWWTYTGRRQAKEPWKLLGYLVPMISKENHGLCRSYTRSSFSRSLVWTTKLSSRMLKNTRIYRTSPTCP